MHHGRAHPSLPQGALGKHAVRKDRDSVNVGGTSRGPQGWYTNAFDGVNNIKLALLQAFLVDNILSVNIDGFYAFCVMYNAIENPRPVMMQGEQIFDVHG